jgi:hypothetical protein
MEPDLLKAIDDEVIHVINAKGAPLVTRSDVLKDLIREALAARTKKRK